MNNCNENSILNCELVLKVESYKFDFNISKDNELLDKRNCLNLIFGIYWIINNGNWITV